MNTYEIFALKYAGPVERPATVLKWMRDYDKTVELAYYIWCLRISGGNAEQTVVVDTGIMPETAAGRNIYGYVNPVEMLSRIDVDASKVEHVILTHMHWDHANGIPLFPNATFYVQEKEYRFWLEDPLAKRPPLKQVSDDTSHQILKSLHGTRRLVLLDGDTELMPGIRCVLAPGHTVGLQAVAADTSKGTAVLGSDCAGLFSNYSEDWPTSIIANMLDWLRTYDKLKSIVSDGSILFPGHDPLMSTSYPEVAEGITRLV